MFSQVAERLEVVCWQLVQSFLHCHHSLLGIFDTIGADDIFVKVCRRIHHQQVLRWGFSITIESTLQGCKDRPPPPKSTKVLEIPLDLLVVIRGSGSWLKKELSKLVTTLTSCHLSFSLSTSFPRWNKWFAYIDKALLKTITQLKMYLLKFPFRESKSDDFASGSEHTLLSSSCSMLTALWLPETR